MKVALRLVLVIAGLLAALPVGAAESETAAPFTSDSHGYALTLPPSWTALARRGADDLADLRFRHDALALSGFYQVYEGSVTDRADRWYENARTRYETAGRAMKQITRMTFSDLESTSMGGQNAWSFGFVTELAQGPAVATRIIFTPRRTGARIDVHEIVITGSGAAFAEGAPSIRALLEAVHYTN